MQIINSIPKSWLYVTCGALIGGLAIRYIGFQGSRERRKGVYKFYKMCLWYLNGITVTSFTTIILRLNPITKEILGKYPKITFIISMIGFFRSFPQLMVLQNSESSFNWKTYVPWIIFWHLPAAYFACFDFSTLSFSMKYSITLITICFIVGTTIPIKNRCISDLGLKVTSSSLFVFVFGMIMKLLSGHTHIPLLFVINTTLIVLFSGLLIDDLQHIKHKLENEDEGDTTSISFHPIRKSVPVFIESVLIFGRIASLLFILNAMQQ